jgi:hypothetical protein
MRTLKPIAVLVLIITTFAACSKKSASEAPPPPEPINLTNYYIAGMFTTEHKGKTLSLPYALYFGPNAKAYSFLGSSLQGPEGSYQLKDGNLLITLEHYGGLVFTITGNSLTNYAGRLGITSHYLEKIPAANALTGNYKGSLRVTNSSLIAISTLSFSSDKCAFGGSLNFPTPNTKYILFNNAVATSYMNSSTMLQLFVLINGKLETSGYNGPEQEFRYGSFTKQ